MNLYLLRGTIPHKPILNRRLPLRSALLQPRRFAWFTFLILILELVWIGFMLERLAHGQMQKF